MNNQYSSDSVKWMKANNSNWLMWFFVKLYMRLHTHPNTHTHTDESEMPLIHLLHGKKPQLRNEDQSAKQSSMDYTHTTHEYTYECSAVHKGKVWGLSLWFNKGRTTVLSTSDCLHVSRYAFITQSKCILTHSLQRMHLYQSAALIQNPSAFEVGSMNKLWFCHLCLHRRHVYTVCEISW